MLLTCPLISFLIKEDANGSFIIAAINALEEIVDKLANNDRKQRGEVVDGSAYGLTL